MHDADSALLPGGAELASTVEDALGVESAARHQAAAEAMLGAFSSDVARLTEVMLLQEESGTTFFIADILKIIIAPFVAILLDPIAAPAMRKGQELLTGSGSVTGGITGPLAKFVGALLALVLGILVAVAVSKALGEALVYHASYQTIDAVYEKVGGAVVENAINDLNDYLFKQAMPAQSEIITGLVTDALSDSLTYGMHHTLTRTLVDGLSASLTPPTMHYYACVYCYYYGSYCDVCSWVDT